ncbi:MAG: adenylosuccinate synthetase, partial [Candidatus Kapabacteria bacterium]|nr:adenylosuccinate synthetase [Candidatus Kapabacteria bacterium]
LTKLDVLNTHETIKVCTGYSIAGKPLKSFPSDCAILEKVEPQYTELPGWMTSLEGIERYDDLPAATRDYIAFIEEFTKARVAIASTSPDRKATIVR